MTDAQSGSGDDGSNYKPNLGPPLPHDADALPPTGPITPHPAPETGPTSPPRDRSAYGEVPPPPPPPGYVPSQSGPYPPASASTQDRQSVTALVTGVLSVIFVLFCGLLSIPLGIAAIVLGAQARKRVRATGQSSAMATTGLVLGILALVLMAIWTAIAMMVGLAD